MKLTSLFHSSLKKSGKWCAVHVRVAWEIYHHQQKQQSDPTKGLEVKPGDPLRPPSHLMPGPALHPRPPEIGGGNPASLLGKSGKVIFKHFDIDSCSYFELLLSKHIHGKIVSTIIIISTHVWVYVISIIFP